MGLPLVIMQLAAAQGGCVTRSQLIECGVSTRTIERMTSAGAMDPATAGVYRLLPSKGWRDDVRAAIAALPGAIVSHHSAAAMLGFPRTKPLAVVSVHTRTTHEFPGVCVRRTHDMAPDHVHDLDGVPVTTAARTVVDLAAVLHPKHLSAIIQDLVLTSQLALPDVAVVLGEVARRGKPGVQSLRATLEMLGPEPTPMTELERRGWALLQRAGVADGVRECAVPWDPDRRFDVAWPDVRVAVEWDSRRWHGALQRMAYDRRRDRAAAINGWVVIRFTWDEVVTRPDRVVDDVRSLIRARSSGVG
jgi:very-short-patch-repair endonuclease